jgi:hypothetical protein
VEFYVISEPSRGKLSGRAVHVSFLPLGTVQFETTLAESVLGYVAVEPKVGSREIPGMIRPCEVIRLAIDDNEHLQQQNPHHSNKNGSPPRVAEREEVKEKEVSLVELWARCLPESLPSFIKVGDLLRFDICLYRPEKLYFARNVRVEKLLSIGRYFGTICDVKDGRGYGFIKSSQGGPDVYFRTGDVLDILPKRGSDGGKSTGRASGGGGVFVAERNVKLAHAVSYNCIAEEVRKAICIILL